MRRMIYALQRFMTGRNGMDYFGYCLWWFYLILFIIQVIVRMISQLAGFVLSILLWILFIYMIFRVLSRNLPARSRENLWWGKVWSKTPFGKKGNARFGGYRGFGGYGYGAGSGGSAFGRDDYHDYTAPPKTEKKKKVKLPKDKDHVYRICPACRANIRLPKKKGAHSVRCPRCSTLFDVKI